MTQPNHCARCRKWAGAHATLPGQPTDHLCTCVPTPVEKAAPSALSKAAKVHAIVNTGPYPGMSEAFNDHMGAECWTDPAYAPDTSTWAAAWKAALKAQHAAQPVATIKDCLTVAQPVAGEPVAEVGDLIIQVRERVMAGGARNRDPLYTAAPAPVGLVPLTEEWLSRHVLLAADCPPASVVVLLSSIKRVIKAGKDGAK